MRVQPFQIIFILLLLIPARVLGQAPSGMSDSVLRVRISENADALFNGDWLISTTGYQKRDSTSIDTIVIDRKNETIRVVADDQLAYFPARFPVIDSIERGLLSGSGEEFESFVVEVISAERNIREYVPNYHRTDKKEMDQERSAGKLKRKSPPLVKNLSKPYLAETNLYNTNIALWHSHGWYYEPSLHRWEWQRARIFQTVEAPRCAHRNSGRTPISAE